MVDCTPDPNLLESMRSVGYSLNTAVADIIDNSIAAHAKTISIRYFDHGEDPYVAIIDDGDGMDYETAVNAMKLAGTNPNAKRNANDLGRFVNICSFQGHCYCRRRPIALFDDYCGSRPPLLRIKATGC